MMAEKEGPQDIAHGPAQTDDEDQTGSSVTCFPSDLEQFAARFLALFAGLERAHGAYIVGDSRRDDGKLEGSATTLRSPVNASVWALHLAGRRGLGIIPIRDDCTVSFGAVDVDVYADLDHAKIATQLGKLKLPLIPCRSKSGGVHIYLFCTEPVPAQKMQERLRDIAARLGFGNSEIFPKQTKTLAENGDLGSWINMPYHSGDKTNRYAIQPNGDPYTMEGFLTAAEQTKVSRQWFDTPLTEAPSPLPDAPPCLQHLVEQGFPQGTRNRGIFNLGVYARKLGDSWKESIHDMNARYLQPALAHDEVLNVIKSLDRKAYFYTCTDSPLAQHCNKVVCRTRRHGVGGEGNRLPVLGSLTKLTTSPPIWFLELEGQRIELSTNELLNPIDFQRRCAESLKGILVPSVKRAVWEAHLRPAMEAVTEIPAPEEASPLGHFSELLEAFCTGRTQAQSLEEVLLGKPYTDDGRTYFRLSDVMTFLERRRIREYSRVKVTTMLKGLTGAEHVFRKLGGRGVNLWCIPEFTRRVEPFPVASAVSSDQGEY